MRNNEAGGIMKQIEYVLGKMDKILWFSGSRNSNMKSDFSDLTL